MLKKWKITAVVLMMLITSVITACAGTGNATEAPQPTSAVIKPASSDTPSAVETSEIALPTTTPVEEKPLPQTANQLNITETNSFKDESDYWYFHGLVQNDMDQTVYDVQVEVSLLDVAGTEVYSYTTYTILSYLEPGEITPFSDFSTEAFPDGKTMQAEVVGFETSQGIKRTALEYSRVTTWADEYNDVYLAGVVFNKTNEPVQINDIAGTLWDGSGKLVSSSSAYPFLSYVEPNGSSPFVMMFDTPLGEAPSLTNYKLYIDAVSTDPISTYDITLSETHNKYQDSNGDMHLVGSVTNNTTEPLNIYLVAGMYDKDGNCIDANVVYMPMPVNPGETFPYDFSVWGAVDYVPTAYEEAVNYQVFVDWLSTFEADPTYILSTKDDANTYDGLAAHFTGNVVNSSGQDLTTALVSVSFYDKKTGELIATNLNFVPDVLTKDATAAYEVYVYPPYDNDPAETEIVITALGQ